MPLDLMNGDLLTVRYVTKLVDQFAWNRIYYVVGEKVGTVTDQTAATSLEDQVSELYKDLLCTVDQWWGLMIQVERSGTLYSTVTSSAERGAGTVTEDRLPPQCSVLITGKTGFAGRDQQARIYFPFAPATSVDSNGRIEIALVADYDAVGNILYAPISIDDGLGNACLLSPVVYHQGTGSWTVINSSTVKQSVSQHKTRSLVRPGDAPPF